MCGIENEDTQHVLKCQHMLSIEFWNKALQEYDMKLAKLKTSYYLCQAIILDLDAWRKGEQYPPMLYADAELQTIIKTQREIGWRSFLEGLMAQTIISYQHLHLQQIDPKKKGTTWAKRVIQASWTLLLEIWEFQNKKTHEKDNIEELQGIQILEEVVQLEWNRGLSKLPALELSQFFQIKWEKLHKKSTEWKKDWLLNVKLGQSLYNDENAQLNKFDTNPALREWIGLPKSGS